VRERERKKGERERKKGERKREEEREKGGGQREGEREGAGRERERKRKRKRKRDKRAKERGDRQERDISETAKRGKCQRARNPWRWASGSRQARRDGTRADQAVPTAADMPVTAVQHFSSLCNGSSCPVTLGFSLGPWSQMNDAVCSSLGSDIRTGPYSGVLYPEATQACIRCGTLKLYVLNLLLQMFYPITCSGFLTLLCFFPEIKVGVSEDASRRKKKGNPALYLLQKDTGPRQANWIYMVLLARSGLMGRAIPTMISAFSVMYCVMLETNSILLCE
jgi:hypothetical protein